MRRNRMQPKSLPQSLLTLLDQYEQWEKSPIGDIYRPSSLSGLTLRGYKSHLKKWIEYVHGLIEASMEAVNWTNKLKDPQTVMMNPSN